MTYPFLLPIIKNLQVKCPLNHWKSQMRRFLIAITLSFLAPHIVSAAPDEFKPGDADKPYDYTPGDADKPYDYTPGDATDPYDYKPGNPH